MKKVNSFLGYTRQLITEGYTNYGFQNGWNDDDVKAWKERITGAETETKNFDSCVHVTVAHSKKAFCLLDSGD